MLSLVFNCENECGQKHEYSQALSHFKDCDLIMACCTQGCGLGILKKDMQYHIDNQCSWTSSPCQRCDGRIYKNQAVKHDCISYLKVELRK